MPTETLAAHATRAMRRWWPEALLAVLAGVVFLGCLGSVDLWGKREQRPRRKRSIRSTTSTGSWPRSRGVRASRSRRCRGGRSPP